MDRLMIDYLRSKSRNMSDQDFMDKFKHFMKYKRNSMGNNVMRNTMARHNNSYFDNTMDDFYMKRHNNPDMDMFEEDDYEDMYSMMKYMRNSMNLEHFNESEAKHIVNEMYHKEGSQEHYGEKYDMHKAKEVLERYKGIIPSTVSLTDVYIAINAQYHDYCMLFKNWFGDNIDHKIIESAIVFWFKDVDYKNKNKVTEYFDKF